MPLEQSLGNPRLGQRCPLSCKVCLFSGPGEACTCRYSNWVGKKPKGSGVALDPSPWPGDRGLTAECSRSPAEKLSLCLAVAPGISLISCCTLPEAHGPGQLGKAKTSQRGGLAPCLLQIPSDPRLRDLRPPRQRLPLPAPSWETRDLKMIELMTLLNSDSIVLFSLKSFDSDGRRERSQAA